MFGKIRVVQAEKDKKDNEYKMLVDVG